MSEFNVVIPYPAEVRDWGDPAGALGTEGASLTARALSGNQQRGLKQPLI
ncbi:hypothetical protein [Neobacillus endophyticus]|nr:hypothetical protein [Neobacillus endophyticus]